MYYRSQLALNKYLFWCDTLFGLCICSLSQGRNFKSWGSESGEARIEGAKRPRFEGEARIEGEA